MAIGWETSKVTYTSAPPRWLVPKVDGVINTSGQITYTDGVIELCNKLDKLGMTVGDLMKILDEIERGADV